MTLKGSSLSSKQKRHSSTRSYTFSAGFMRIIYMIVLIVLFNFRILKSQTESFSVSSNDKFLPFQMLPFNCEYTQHF